MASVATTHDDTNEHDGLAFPWRNVLGLLLLGLTLLGVHGWRQFDGVTSAETMEMAALARNLAQGRGFVASCVRPADLWFMSSRSDEPVTVSHMPDLRHGPLYPSLLAALYMCSGLDETLPLVDFTHRAESYVILPLSIVLTMLAGFIIFVTTRRLAGDSPAHLALAMFVLSLPVLQLGLWGGAGSLVLFLSAAAAWAGVRCVAYRDGLHGDETAGWLAPLLLAGFLVGLTVLTRYGAWGTGVVLLLYLFHGQDRKRCWASSLVFLATILLTLAPWLIRNLLVSGTWFGMAPYAMLNHSSLFEADGFDASLHPVLGNLAVARAVKAKFIANSLGLLQGNVAALGVGILMILFIASFFVRFENERLVALRQSALGAVLVMMVLVALGSSGTTEIMTDLLPWMFILATTGFYSLIHNIDFHEPEKETLALLALLLWTATPVALALLGSSTHRAYPPYHPPFIRHVSGLLSRGESVCTDIPWATAWYGGRTAILLPRSVDAFRELHQEVPSLAGLYLTTETARLLYADPGAKRSRASWRSLLSGQIPPNFPFTEAIAFPASSKDQWFYTDRKHLSKR